MIDWLFRRTFLILVLSLFCSRISHVFYRKNGMGFTTRIVCHFATMWSHSIFGRQFSGTSPLQWSAIFRDTTLLVVGNCSVNQCTSGKFNLSPYHRSHFFTFAFHSPFVCDFPIHAKRGELTSQVECELESFQKSRGEFTSHVFIKKLLTSFFQCLCVAHHSVW